MQHPSSTFADSNKFFIRNGVVRYFCPGTSYLAKVKHGLSLDSVLYNEYKASCAQPTRLVCDEHPQDELPEPEKPRPEEDEDEPEESGEHDPYDKLFSKCRTSRRTTKMPKTQYLGLAKPRKSVYIPKSTKKVYLVSRDTKSWHQGEYTHTNNPDMHDDYCECDNCSWIRDEKMFWENYDGQWSDSDCWSNYTADLLRQNDFDDEVLHIVDGVIIL
jgi:hypothetical protein